MDRAREHCHREMWRTDEREDGKSSVDPDI